MRKPVIVVSAVAALAASFLVLSGARPHGVALLSGRIAQAAPTPTAVASNRFSVDIEGGVVPGVVSVTGLESESEAAQSRVGADSAPQTRPGAQKPGKIVITRAFTGNPDFFTWRKAIADGRMQPKSINVTAYDAEARQVARFNLLRCWPLKWTGPSFSTRNGNDAATESLELAFESIAMATAK